MAQIGKRVRERERGHIWRCPRKTTENATVINYPHKWLTTSWIHRSLVGSFYLQSEHDTVIKQQTNLVFSSSMQTGFLKKRCLVCVKYKYNISFLTEHRKHVRCLSWKKKDSCCSTVLCHIWSLSSLAHRMQRACFPKWFSNFDLSVRITFFHSAFLDHVHTQYLASSLHDRALTCIWEWHDEPCL